MLLFVIAIGAALRFHQLGALPPGLYQDEAYNGLDALDVIGGARPVYFAANNGREPLYVYLTAVSVAALGRTPAAVRLPAAAIGVLTIPAAYALGRALFGRRAGLLAAAICAVTFWPVALSRVGFRAGALPLAATLSLACAAAGWRNRRPWLVALGGALYGLTFYTYLAARFTPLALSVFLIFWYIACRRTFPPARWLAAFAVPAAVVAAPLAAFALRQPQLFVGRADQVSILNPAVNGGDLYGTLLHNLLAALGMFIWRGDTIGRHNLPGRAVFDPLLGAAFIVGVVIALARMFARPARKRDRAAAFAVIWTGAMLIPTILAEDAPHFLRGVGVLPVIFLFPAIALEALWGVKFRRRRTLEEPGDRISRLKSEKPAEPGSGPATGRPASSRLPDFQPGVSAGGGSPGILGAPGGWLAAAMIAASLGLAVRDYFFRYARDPSTGYLFQSAAAELARDVNGTTAIGWTGGWSVRPAAGEPSVNSAYLDRRLWDNFPSLRFLSPQSDRLVFFDDRNPPAIADSGYGTIYLWPYEDPRPALKGIPPETMIWPQAGPLYRGDLEPDAYSLYSAYRIAPYSRGAAAPAAEFQSGFRLLHLGVSPGTDGFEMNLVWQSDRAPGKDYQVFAQALLGGDIVAQADGPLGAGLYPSRWWRAGEIVEEVRRLILPQGVNRAGVRISVGLYDPVTGERTRRTDATGDSVDIAP